MHYGDAMPENGWAEIGRLRARIKLLEEALDKEWRSYHIELCDDNWPHEDCRWERPAILEEGWDK